MPNPFGDGAMAAGYAAARPPVHQHVVALLQQWTGPVGYRLAVDIGCGAGLSTRPLVALASCCVGIDPADSMVRTARRIVPQATFVTAAGEAMPFARGSVDLLTAAGSLNYARDLDAVWPEALRVLAPRGVLVVYDFTAARSFADRQDIALDTWYERFVRRYPPPVSGAVPLSPAILSTRARGLRVTRSDTFELALDLTPDFYVSYMLTETNVHQAARGGVAIDTVREWCTATLAPVFGARPRTVLVRGYLATLQPAAGHRLAASPA